METVRERLARAQASGKMEEIEAALRDAQAAGADPAAIEQALSEVQRVKSKNDSGQDTGSADTTADSTASTSKDEAADAEREAAEARARADGLKQRGNASLKAGTKSAAREALEFFTAGLEVRCLDNVLNAQLYSNRAHVRLQLRQFVEAVDDCRKAIEIDPKNMKAYWRAAKASLNLDLCRNGIEFCEAGLRQEPNDPDLMKLRATCADKLAAQQQRRAEMATTAGARTDFNADEAMAVQDRVNELNEQVEIMKMQQAGKQRERLKGQLTMKEIESCPADTKMYLSVGRGFVLEDRQALEKRIKIKSDHLEEELPKLNNAIQEMDKRKDAAEKELREMVQAFKHQQGG